MDRIRLVSRSPGFKKVLSVSVQFQLKVGIRHDLGGVDAVLAAGCGLLPFLTEEKRRTRRGSFPFSLAFSFSLRDCRVRLRLLGKNAKCDS